MEIDLITQTGESVTVEYTYDPGEPDQWYDSNGDPGTPGYGPSADITHVWYSGIDRRGNLVNVDVMNLIDEDFEQEILDYHEF